MKDLDNLLDSCISNAISYVSDALDYLDNESDEPKNYGKSHSIDFYDNHYEELERIKAKLSELANDL